MSSIHGYRSLSGCKSQIKMSAFVNAFSRLFLPLSSLSGTCETKNNIVKHCAYTANSHEQENERSEECPYQVQNRLLGIASARTSVWEPPSRSRVTINATRFLSLQSLQHEISSPRSMRKRLMKSFWCSWLRRELRRKHRSTPRAKTFIKAEQN